jgi:hypothetical protein
VKSAADAVFFGMGRKRSSEGPAKVEGVGRGESRGGYRERKTPESFNPKDGFGMKQGRADEGRTKRQEVEKT